MAASVVVHAHAASGVEVVLETRRPSECERRAGNLALVTVPSSLNGPLLLKKMMRNFLALSS
jgi:hypothetical protein